MENNTKKVGLVIMASGLGKRFGGNKLMAELNGKPLIKWVIDASEGLFDKRVVVTRNDEVKTLCESINIECVYHKLPNRNDTVRLGLSSIMQDIDYCFFTPGDQPLISTNTLSSLINEAKQNTARILRPCCEDIIGAPVGFSSLFFNDLLTLPEGKGGNWIAKNNQEAIRTIKISNKYELFDIDTPSDLEAIRQITKILIKQKTVTVT